MGVWFLDLKSGSGIAGQGQPSVKADVTMTMDSKDFSKMFAGEYCSSCTSNEYCKLAVNETYGLSKYQLIRKAL